MNRLIRAYDGGHHVKVGPKYQQPRTGPSGSSANIGLMNAAADYCAGNANEGKAREYLLKRLEGELGTWGLCQNEILGQYEKWICGAFAMVHNHAIFEGDEEIVELTDKWLEHLTALLAIHAMPGRNRPGVDIVTPGMRMRAGWQIADRWRGELFRLLAGKEPTQIQLPHHAWYLKPFHDNRFLVPCDKPWDCRFPQSGDVDLWVADIDELLEALLCGGLRTHVPIEVVRQPHVLVSVLRRGHSSGLTRPLLAAWSIRGDAPLKDAIFGMHDVYPKRRGSHGVGHTRLEIEPSNVRLTTSYGNGTWVEDIPLRPLPTLHLKVNSERFFWEWL
jgi:hypothetical protein